MKEAVAVACRDYMPLKMRNKRDILPGAMNPLYMFEEKGADDNVTGTTISMEMTGQGSRTVL